MLQADLDLLARAYYISNWQWNTDGTGTGTGVGSSLSNAQLRQLARRIDNRTLQFSRTFRTALNRSSINGTSQEDEASRNLIALESATRQLTNRTNTGQFPENEARNVLDRAAVLNSLMANYEFALSAERDWTTLKQISINSPALLTSPGLEQHPKRTNL